MMNCLSLLSFYLSIFRFVSPTRTTVPAAAAALAAAAARCWATAATAAARRERMENCGTCDIMKSHEIPWHLQAGLTSDYFHPPFIYKFAWPSTNKTQQATHLEIESPRLFHLHIPPAFNVDDFVAFHWVPNGKRLRHCERSGSLRPRSHDGLHVDLWRDTSSVSSVSSSCPPQKIRFEFKDAKWTLQNQNRS